MWNTSSLGMPIFSTVGAMNTGHTRLHFVDFGPRDTEPIVFLGSLASTWQMWIPQLDAVASTRRVIAFDHHGHGNSALKEGPLSVAAMAEDVVATLDELGVEKCGVVGLSLGGLVAQQMVLVNPQRVTKVALLATRATFQPASQWDAYIEHAITHGMEAQAAAMIPQWFGRDFAQTHPATVAGFQQMIAGISCEGFVAAFRALGEEDFRPRLHQISVPTLVIAGRGDCVTPVEGLEEIAALIPNARLVEVDAEGHLINIESEREVTRLIQQHFF
ncbi:3-oxoadipate enol-lactonase [Corynebacterium felinum]